MKADSVRTIFYALGANLAIAAAKTGAAITTGSSAMLAEAIHSYADSGNQVLLLWGMKQAKRPASADYPLGWGKALFFWSFIVAIVLFSLGGLFSLYEGWHKLRHPQDLTNPWVAVGILVFGLAAEAVSMRACLQEVNKVRGDRTIWRWFRESRQSELVVILGEDVAALLGLALALIAVVATMITGNPLFDAWGSIAIGVLLGVIAVFVAREVASLLVGKSAEVGVREAIEEFVRKQPDVERLFNLITLQLGPYVMVATKAKMRGELSAREQIEAINRVEAAMKAQFTEIRWSFFEPDFED